MAYDDLLLLIENIAEELYDDGIVVSVGEEGEGLGFDPADQIEESEEYDNVFYDLYFNQLPEEIQDAYRKRAECVLA